MKVNPPSKAHLMADMAHDTNQVTVEEQEVSSINIQSSDSATPDGCHGHSDWIPSGASIALHTAAPLNVSDVDQSATLCDHGGSHVSMDSWLVWLIE